MKYAIASAVLSGLLMTQSVSTIATPAEPIRQQAGWDHYDRWDRWDRRDRWDGSDRRYRHRGYRTRQAYPLGWKGQRWYRQPGLRRGWSGIYWKPAARHFWPTQRWSQGQCYRVDRLPGGAVRRVPLPGAACF
jgi:hypothetical protein